MEVIAMENNNLKEQVRKDVKEKDSCIKHQKGV